MQVDWARLREQAEELAEVAVRPGERAGADIRQEMARQGAAARLAMREQGRAIREEMARQGRAMKAAIRSG
jgi:hypothetical protein